jgi:hypothetical protein
MPRIQVAVSVTFIAVWAAACTTASDSDPDESGFETVETTEGSCDLIEELSLTVDEVSPNGLNGDDLLLRAEGTHLSTLTYADDTAIPIHVTVTYSAGDVTYYDRDLSGDPDPALVASCIDGIEVAVLLDIVTDDGVFNELLIPVHLIAHVEDESFWSTTIDPADFGGTFEITEIDPASFDTIEIVIEGTFGIEGSEGRFSGVAVGDTVEHFEIARWVAFGQEG